ncbi:hypothetical protein AB0937_33995 [Streptomyces sp. NPDC047880]|jgi:hypothetical protein|uniref:hypothetical protein n=1 Tax=Streptomyces TaxID=1883 RepID=UPI0013BF1BC9|nr:MULTISPECIES: hypothetical protein [Streptomyces]NEB62635.1 hypothetical protein [Streptomyces diastaticus]NEC26426.1 hypothetical protein [Streptomyces sp. SID8111]WUB58780.1 hypothetical protein OG942_43870 [Streptomyces griseorubiginosus]
MTDELWHLMRETTEVRRLADALRLSDLAGTTTPDQEREYLLRRAAVDQRHLVLFPADEKGIAEAQRSAVMLRDHDAVHASHQGAVPAAAPQWVSLDGAADYVRQEAAAAGLTGQG